MGKNGVAWSKEVGEALIKLKEHLRNLPTLARPRPNEPLVIYLSTSREAISAVLVAEREKKSKCQSILSVEYYRVSNLTIRWSRS